jgi:hypothetical protein
VIRRSGKTSFPDRRASRTTVATSVRSSRCSTRSAIVLSIVRVGSAFTGTTSVRVRCRIRSRTPGRRVPLRAGTMKSRSSRKYQNLTTNVVEWRRLGTRRHRYALRMSRVRLVLAVVRDGPPAGCWRAMISRSDGREEWPDRGFPPVRPLQRFPGSHVVVACSRRADLRLCDRTPFDLVFCGCYWSLSVVILQRMTACRRPGLLIRGRTALVTERNRQGWPE